MLLKALQHNKHTKQRRALQVNTAKRINVSLYSFIYMILLCFNAGQHDYM